MTKDLLVSLNISKVVHIRTNDDKPRPQFADLDPYVAAKEMGIFEEMEAENLEDELTIEKIAKRVQDNKEHYEAKV